MRTICCTGADSVDVVAGILNGGGVAVIPTDTVYGLAAHPAHADAVERLYAIKGRERRKKIALLAADAPAPWPSAANARRRPGSWRRGIGRGR